MNGVQIVLAAGKSSRMGEPKPLLDFDGKTTLDLVVEAGADAGVDRTVIVVGHRCDEVRSVHDFSSLSANVFWVTNDDAGSEQMRSLQLALESLEANAADEAPDVFLFQPVDFPLVTAYDYRLLPDDYEARADRSALVIYLSHARRRGHPVLCDMALSAEILAANANSSVRDVLATHACAYALTENAGVLEDMDTIADYRKCLEAYRIREASER